MRSDFTVGDRQSELMLQVILEIAPIVVGLKADQIIGEHRRYQIGVMRYRRHCAAGRPRRVQEESDRAADIEPAQLRAERQKMVVLNPHLRLRSNKSQQCTRHEGVDFAVRGIFVGSDLDEIGPRVQRRPQCRIGEAFVISAIMLRRHVDCRQRAVAKRLDLGKGISVLRCIAGLTAGTDPDRARLPHHRDQRRCQSTGDGFIAFCPRNAVGNDDHAHEKFLQLRGGTTRLTIKCSRSAALRKIPGGTAEFRRNLLAWRILFTIKQNRGGDDKCRTAALSFRNMRSSTTD